MMQDQWIHEFLAEEPGMLDEVWYLCLPGGDEPELCVSPIAVRAFMHWALRRGYGNRETVEAFLQCVDEATDAPPPRRHTG
jgi:hypothetical protein